MEGEYKDLQRVSLSFWVSTDHINVRKLPKGREKPSEIISENSPQGSQKDWNSLYSHQPDWKNQLCHGTKIREL